MTQRTFLDYDGLQRFLNNLKTIIPSKTSDLTNDSGFLTQHNPIDSSLSETSENAVQNKVVKGALDGKSDTGHTHTASEVSGLSAVATSGSYNDLSNTPTIPTVNNAKLTIQRNGTTVKTFTANASSNVTANITVPTAVSELTNDSGYLTSASSLDSSKLTGTIDIARLPKGALERLVTVANQTARFALTVNDVQLGDTVKQLDTGVMYIVTDVSKLSQSGGYTEYTAGSATSVPWSGVTGKPSSFTPSSHTHGNVTNDGKLQTASRALISDSSKNITVSSVTDTELEYLSGVTSAIQTQLNGKSASNHVHGNITNDGKVGTTANVPLITGTGGVIQAGSFGNTANTFCEGNDSRLSDARTPVSHTHLTADVTDLLSDTHTWTSQQSYNSDLNLNYANTDVDDIVNSVAGSSVLDNFVHMSGDETVNGIKSFPDGIVANVTGSATSATNDGSGNVISTTYGKLGTNNTWTNENIFQRQGRACSFKNPVAESGSTVEASTFIAWLDKAGNQIGYINRSTSSVGNDTMRFCLVSKRDVNGNPSTSGTERSCGLDFVLDSSSAYSITPTASEITNLGAYSVPWKSVYAQSYYYNGTEFQNKFVTLDTTQTITYSKTFTSGAFLDVHGYRLRVINDDMEVGVVPSSNQWTGMLFTDKNKTNISEIVQSFQSNGNTLWQVIITPNEANAQRRIILGYGYNSANNVNNFSVYSDFTPNSSGTFNLGASNQKWKSFNGINPGALSLPSGGTTENTDWYNVAGDILPTGGNATDFTGGQNFFTPSKDGWLALSVVNCESLAVWISSLNYGLSVVAPNTNENRQLIIPVVAGKQVEIKVKGSRWHSARLIVTQGNV